MCPHGYSNNPYCHQMTTQTHPRGNKRISEKVEIRNFFNCHKQAYTTTILLTSASPPRKGSSQSNVVPWETRDLEDFDTRGYMYVWSRYQKTKFRKLRFQSCPG